MKRYLNTSMTYFSYLSEIGTIYQRLILRTPLACVSRRPAKAYTPQPAKVDLAKKLVVLKAVMAQISRQEYLAKIPRYNEDSGPQDGDELCRFLPAEWQQKSIDVKARDKMTVDEILNNSVFASLYYGDIMCSFCCNMIVTRDIADVMAHLVNRHKKLVRSWFSCPVCISTTITDWNSFSNHWLRYHSSCLGLIVVLEGANIAARLSMGLALHTWISSCKLMKVWLQENMDSEVEAPLMRSAIGGYTEKDLYEAEQLAEAIRDDQTEFLPMRLAEEFRRTEAEWQLAKMREAEKRKREAAYMDMPPPNSYA